MKFTRTLLVAAVCLALAHSVPVPNEESFKSQALDRLMVAESANDQALRDKRTIGILRQLFPDISKDANPESENHISELGGSESQNNEVRVQFDDEPNQVANEATEPELTPLDDIEETGDDENRNKRFLNFGFGASGGNGGSGGSGAGSGNFLFDIIRQAADGAARAAGTVYRVVAGTQSLGLGLSASRELGPAAANASGAAPAAPGGAANLSPPLVAGSGSSGSGGDQAHGAAAPAATEAVPGPVTRLFVIANRGISNLVQDLILRLAATSERIVNFKARLITSII